MSKSDKELTTEIVTACVSSWPKQIQKDSLIDLIKSVHKTVKELGDAQEDTN